MDSFLSGFSHNYEGTPIGQGYPGTANVSGNTGAVSSQGVDVTQLQPGDTFQGEIVSVNGEDVQIQLTNGEYMAAKLERDVQLAIGQVMNLQVQSNKDNRIVLKPVYDGKMQMLRVGESALRAAQMAVTDRNLKLVSTLLENGMSIDKKTLMQFNRLTLQNPAASMADLVKLSKLQLPVNDNSLNQLQNYQNLEHKLLDGIREASDELLKLYDTLAGKSTGQGGQNMSMNMMSDAAQGTMAGQTAASTAGQMAMPSVLALENGGKFMEQVLILLAGEEGQAGEAHSAANQGNQAVVAQEGANTQSAQSSSASMVQEGQSMQSVGDAQAPLEKGNQSGAASLQQENQRLSNTQNIQSNAENSVHNMLLNKEGATIENPSKATLTSVKENSQEQPAAETLVKMGADKAAAQPQGQEGNTGRVLDTILGQLKNTPMQVLPGKMISMIREEIKSEQLDIKDMKQLLLDSELGKQLTTEQKAEIFRSEPFRSLLKNGLQKQWTLTPQELMQEGKVEEFYQRLARQSSQLTRMMNEAMQQSGQQGSGTQARAMGNISENVEFMNQMNQIFNYVQLPLKLGNSQANGELYVYTNKKNMARKDGMLTAFLHLDMDYLGSLDVSISLQTQRNQVTTKFYLDEDSIALVEGHIDELAQRLSRKGYQCKNMILEKEEDKTVLEHMEEQIAGGNAVLGYRTFDTRA